VGCGAICGRKVGFTFNNEKQFGRNSEDLRSEIANAVHGPDLHDVQFGGQPGPLAAPGGGGPAAKPASSQVGSGKP
jgi:hypothetical protein